MSLAKLTSISTQTLSLLLERQRLQSLPPLGAPATSSNLHIPQITRNLKQLRKGIFELEEKEGRSEAVGLLRSQYGRMRGLLGKDADEAGIENLDEAKEDLPADGASGSGSGSGSSTPYVPQISHTRSSSVEPIYTPYADDPEAGPDPAIMLQEQRRLMDGQDAHLDALSHSINRQRDLSLQINGELGVHQGLLEELDYDLDSTHNRLGRARQRLDRVAKGAKNHWSALTIGGIIFVLLILIISFKT
ncbi:hypothetical protein OF83DRAFT_1055001 [Amylostereum chailletii]|nr:hypothetical protein OF83DRAFT_1055001 [Amylostereum chailletii]